MPDSLPQVARVIVDVVELSTGDIPISLVDDFNPTDRLKAIALKPANCPKSSDDWCFEVRFLGVPHAWCHAWSDWYPDQLMGEENCRTGNPFIVGLFGQVGQEAVQGMDNRSTREEFRLVSDRIVAQPLERPVEEFGLFGRWFAGSGIAREYMPIILREWFDD